MKSLATKILNKIPIPQKEEFKKEINLLGPESFVNRENYDDNCGPIAVATVLKSFGYDFDSFKDDDEAINLLKKELDKRQGLGTTPDKTVSFFKKLGYDAKIYSDINFESILDNFNGEIDPKIEFAINRKTGSKKEELKDKLKEAAVYFKENPENLVYKKGTINDIKSFLNEEKRIIALINNNTHYVVVSGYNKKFLKIIDPNYPNKIRNIPWKDVEREENWSGELIIIDKK